MIIEGSNRNATRIETLQQSQQQNNQNKYREKNVQAT